MNDRIKLAEAMGPRYTASRTAINFDPFTDANDDVAVLSWASDEWSGTGMWAEFVAAFREPDEDGFSAITKWHYRVGDFARAALKVIE